MRLRYVLGFACALSLAVMSTSCATSRMASGDKYQSGDTRYDGYFESVHAVQTDASTWDADKKNARKPIIAALDIGPSSIDETIVRKTKERAARHGGKDPSIAGPYDETRRLEIERGRKLIAAVEKLEQLSRQGRELKAQADKEFENRGADKADEKKTEKSREVRRELGGSIDACESMTKDARKGIKEAEEFLEDIAAANEAKDPPRPRVAKSPFGAPPAAAAPPPPPKEEPKEEPAASKKHDDKKHGKHGGGEKHGTGATPGSSGGAPPPKPKPAAAEKPAPAEKPEPAPKPAPAEKPKPAPAEEFNP